MLRLLICPLWEILIEQTYKLDTWNQAHICQVSPQLSCGDTFQIWMWYHIGKNASIILKTWEIYGRERIG